MSRRVSWLIGKSAYVRLGASPWAAEWVERIERGLVYVTTPMVLEVAEGVGGVEKGRAGAVAVSRLETAGGDKQLLEPAGSARSVRAPAQRCSGGSARRRVLEPHPSLT
jgi:hypothetical protein